MRRGPLRGSIGPSPVLPRAASRVGRRHEWGREATPLTTVISVLGILGRAIGRVLTSSLGWAASLLYGRVPTSHQRYVEARLGGSLLWAALVLLTLVPPAAAFVFSTTPCVAPIRLS